MVKHTSLTKLQRTLHVLQCIAEYVSHVTVIYLIPTLIYDLKELLHGVDDFSVLCDGSTDRSETDKELIMLKMF